MYLPRTSSIVLLVAIPFFVAPGWREAASKIGFADALLQAVDLDQAQYETLHDGGVPTDLHPVIEKGFVIDAVGGQQDRQFSDYGIEYYKYVKHSS